MISKVRVVGETTSLPKIEVDSNGHLTLIRLPDVTSKANCNPHGLM